MIQSSSHEALGRRNTRSHGRTAQPAPPAQKSPRSADSYKRSLPKESDITETKDHPVDACARCHGSFSKRETAAYFEEDIPLPQKRIVTRHVVEKGYC